MNSKKRYQEKGRQRQTQCLNEDKVFQLSDSRGARLRPRGQPEEEVNAAKCQSQKRAFRHAAHDAQKGDCDGQQHIACALLAEQALGGKK
jgi:hypothetical protein